MLEINTRLRRKIIFRKDKMLLPDIVKELGAGEWYVRRVIAGRPHLKRLHKRRFATRQQLIDDYTNNNMSRTELAFKYGYKTKNSVAQALYFYGIKRRRN